MTVKPPLSQTSYVVDGERRWTREWYGWLEEMINSITDVDTLGGLTPTKGRLVVGDGAAWNTLNVGTDGQVLTADSAQTVGLKYSALSTPEVDIIYVKDAPYNAAVDGVTDDTTAIQDAIDDGVALGKVVHLGYGTSIVDRLVIDTGLVLWGYGKGKSVLKRKASSTLDSVLKGTSKNNFVLRNFSIDGNKASQTVNSNNIWLDTCYSFRIIDVESKNCKGQHISATNHIGHGLYLIDCADFSQGTRSWVVRCDLSSNDHHGLEGHRSGNLTISECRANLNERQGIAFFNFTDPHVSSGNIANVHILGCEASENVVGNGISLPGFWESGNFSAPIYGVGAADGYACVVANNICRGNGRYGIAFQANNSVCVGNVSSDNTYSQGLINCGWSAFVGNHFSGSGTYCVDAGGATECLITGNTFAGGDVLLNLGASINTICSGNMFDADGSTTTCVHLPGVDGDGVTPFPWVGRNTQIVGNTFFGNSGSLGIWVRRNFRHCLVSGNRLTGFDDNDAIRIETVNGQVFDNFTRPGTGDSVTQTYASAATLVLPDHVNFAWVSGSTDITDLKLYSRNVFDGKVMDVNITNGGSGYSPGSPPTVSFSGGGGAGAAATAEVSNGGQVIGVEMTNFGSGYTSAPSVSFSSGTAAGNALVSARNNEDRILTLRFTGSLTVLGPGNDIKIKNDFQAKNEAVLVLYGSSGAWYEVSRANEDFSATATSGSGTGASGSVTLNRMVGTVTTNSANNAEDSNFVFTVNNNLVAAADHVFVSFDNGSNSAGLPAITRVTVNAGSFDVRIRNTHLSGAGTAFNGTFVIKFLVIKA